MFRLKSHVILGNRTTFYPKYSPFMKFYEIFGKPISIPVYDLIIHLQRELKLQQQKRIRLIIEAKTDTLKDFVIY